MKTTGIEWGCQKGVVTMSDRIELKAAKLPDGTGIHCVVCGYTSYEPLMVAEGRADDGEGVVICPHCLVEGDIDGKLDRHAAGLEARAQWLRALRGRLEPPSLVVIKEFASPQDAERVAAFWQELSHLLDQGDLPPIALARLLHTYRGLWPLIVCDAEVDTERGKALATALAKRREFFPRADR
jgi:hypothetical protein